MKLNFLSEFLTELEKALARENLGVTVTGKYEYPHTKPIIDKVNDILSIYDALDYVVSLTSSYLDKLIENTVLTLREQLDKVLELVNNPTQGIDALNESVLKINDSIVEINSILQNLNVDDLIEQWIKSHSGTVSLDDNNKLGFAISKSDGNAIKQNLDGLYVENSADAIYKTNLEDNETSSILVGGIPLGTRVGELKGKTFSAIIDSLLFPATTRELVYPYFIDSQPDTIVAINTLVSYTPPTYILGDAGSTISRTDTATINSESFTSSTYNIVGDVVYVSTVEYLAGDYLIDSKGNTTLKRVEQGSVTNTSTVSVTYPWYYNNTVGPLTKYNLLSEVFEILLTGKCIIKIPGVNSTIDTFKVDGGLGYMDVDLSGWTKSQEDINGYTYLVWTKQDNYVSEIPHKILFTLK